MKTTKKTKLLLTLGTSCVVPLSIPLISSCSNNIENSLYPELNNDTNNNLNQIFNEFKISLQNPLQTPLYKEQLTILNNDVKPKEQLILQNFNLLFNLPYIDNSLNPIYNCSYTNNDLNIELILNNQKEQTLVKNVMSFQNKDVNFLMTLFRENNNVNNNIQFKFKQNDGTISNVANFSYLLPSQINLENIYIKDINNNYQNLNEYILQINNSNPNLKLKPFLSYDDKNGKLFVIISVQTPTMIVPCYFKEQIQNVKFTTYKDYQLTTNKILDQTSQDLSIIKINDTLFPSQTDKITNYASSYNSDVLIYELINKINLALKNNNSTLYKQIENVNATIPTTNGYSLVINSSDDFNANDVDGTLTIKFSIKNNLNQIVQNSSKALVLTISGFEKTVIKEPYDNNKMEAIYNAYSIIEQISFKNIVPFLPTQILKKAQTLDVKQLLTHILNNNELTNIKQLIPSFVFDSTNATPNLLATFNLPKFTQEQQNQTSNEFYYFKLYLNQNLLLNDLNINQEINCNDNIGSMNFNVYLEISVDNNNFFKVLPPVSRKQNYVDNTVVYGNSKKESFLKIGNFKNVFNDKANILYKKINEIYSSPNAPIYKCSLNDFNQLNYSNDLIDLAKRTNHDIIDLNNVIYQINLQNQNSSFPFNDYFKINYLLNFNLPYQNETNFKVFEILFQIVPKNANNNENEFYYYIDDSQNPPVINDFMSIKIKVESINS